MTASAKWDHGWPTEPAPEEPRQLGLSFVDLFDVYRGVLHDPDPTQLRRVGVLAASSATRGGWRTELADVLRMLGVTGRVDEAATGGAA